MQSLRVITGKAVNADVDAGICNIRSRIYKMHKSLLDVHIYICIMFLLTAIRILSNEAFLPYLDFY
jgi:hypothetical protein